MNGGAASCPRRRDSTRAPLRSLSPVFGRRGQRALVKIAPDANLTNAPPDCPAGLLTSRSRWPTESRVALLGGASAPPAAGACSRATDRSGVQRAGPTTQPSSSSCLAAGPRPFQPGRTPGTLRRGRSLGRTARGWSTTRPNEGMKLTKLSAAWLREWTCRLMPAPVGLDAGTASQLIPGVRPTWARTPGASIRSTRLRATVFLIAGRAC
jgi:hypothetical protein